MTAHVPNPPDTDTTEAPTAADDPTNLPKQSTDLWAAAQQAALGRSLADRQREERVPAQINRSDQPFAGKVSMSATATRELGLPPGVTLAEPADEPAGEAPAEEESTDPVGEPAEEVADAAPAVYTGPPTDSFVWRDVAARYPSLAAELDARPIPEPEPEPDTVTTAAPTKPVQVQRAKATDSVFDVQPLADASRGHVLTEERVGRHLAHPRIDRRIRGWARMLAPLRSRRNRGLRPERTTS